MTQTALEMMSDRTARLQAWAGFSYFGYAALVAIAAWWTWRGLHDPGTLDLGLAYQGGQVAWATGHPENLLTWISTPFLGVVMAIVTRVTTVGTAADLLTLLNLAFVFAVGAPLLHRLRGVLSPVWWWPTAFAIVTFAPMLSSVWWKQFNILSLGLSVVGFELIRRQRAPLGGAFIGLSISIKPLAILLPVVLVVRRDTRRAGIWALAYTVGFNILGQAFMAVRAHNIATLNFLPLISDFDHKGIAYGWACNPENFAPGSLLCRVMGSQAWNVQHLIVWLGVALLGAWTVNALRGCAADSWDVFAFTSALSVMLSPIAWSHYQIMLAPLFVVLLTRFVGEGASPSAWGGLALAFLLSSLMLRPYGTLVGAVRGVTGYSETPQELAAVEGVAQFAQYVLVITGILWYFERRVRTRGAMAAPRMDSRT